MNAELDIVRAQFASDLHALIDNRQTSEEERTEALTEDEWLDDPDQSFIKFLDISTQETLIAEINESTGNLRQVWHGNKATTDLVTYFNKFTRYFCDVDENEFTYLADDYHLQKGIREIQKHLLATPDITSQMTGLSLLGYIAAYTKPAGVLPEDTFKRHKRETPKERTFRTAINTLKQYSERPPTIAELAAMDAVSPIAKLKETHTTDPVRARQGVYAINHRRLQRLAGSIRARVLSPGLRSEDFYEELEAWDKRLNQREAISDEQPAEIPVQETGWTILPPDILDQLNIDGNGEPGKGSTPKTVDKKRLLWLGNIAAAWGDGAYIAVTDLTSTGDYEYHAAILPETLPTGVHVKHAIVENPSTGNATFVFRGEQGVDDEEVWLTWEDVFRDTRKGAKALGARRMLHVPTLDDNVMEYLTRDPQDLEKPGYRR